MIMPFASKAISTFYCPNAKRSALFMFVLHTVCRSRTHTSPRMATAALHIHCSWMPQNASWIGKAFYITASHKIGSGGEKNAVRRFSRTLTMVCAQQIYTRPPLFLLGRCLWYGNVSLSFVFSLYFFAKHTLNTLCHVVVGFLGQNRGKIPAVKWASTRAIASRSTFLLIGIDDFLCFL